MPKLNYNVEKKNVRYQLIDTDIECYVLLSGKPAACRILVNHKWRSASVFARKGASVILEYTGDGGNDCYQEWIAEPDGGYRRVHMFGSRLPNMWKNEI